MLNNLLNYIKERGVFTSERPINLEADVLARYSFASKYCKGKEVLDVGTGLGFGAAYISNAGAKTVLGIDYSKETINMISSTNKLTNVHFKYENVLDLRHISHKKYDVILAFEIIEHLPSDQVDNFVRSIKKIIRKNGILIITTPNGLMTNFVWGRPYNPYHVKEYTGNEIYNILKPHFSKISIMGMTNKNDNYLAQQKEIEKGMVYNLLFFLGHFKTVRELVVFFPKSLRKLITKENKLPAVNVNDFLLTKNWQDSPSLFVKALVK